MSVFASVNDAVLAAFGEAVVFQTDAGAVTLTGVVDRPAGPLTSRTDMSPALDGPALGADDMRVTARTADVAAAGIGPRDIATIDGHAYTVAGLWPDSGGMTALELRA